MRRRIWRSLKYERIRLCSYDPARSLCDNLTVLCDSLDIAQRLTAQIAPKQNWRVR